MTRPFTLFDLNAILNLPPSWDIRAVEADGPVVLVSAELHNPVPMARCECTQPKWIRNGKGTAIVRGCETGGRPVICKVDFQMWRCSECRRKGYGQADLGLTPLLPVFERQLGDYLLEHSVSDAHREFAVSYETLKRLLYQRLDEAMGERIVPDPSYLAIDDTMIAGGRRLCIFDIERGTYIEIFPGYSGSDLRNFLDSHPHWRQTLKAVAIDPYNPFRVALNNYMPELPICVDRFHVVAIVQRAIQRWMRVYLENYNVAMKPKSVWQTRNNTSIQGQIKLSKHPQLLEAMNYVDQLSDVYEQSRRQDALYAWHHWVRALPPFLEEMVGPTITELDTKWRIEICQSVEYRVGTDKPLGTGRLEAKHKRVDYWSAVTPGASFVVLRKRLLLELSRAQKKEKVERLLREIERLKAS